VLPDERAGPPPVHVGEPPAPRRSGEHLLEHERVDVHEAVAFAVAPYEPAVGRGDIDMNALADQVDAAGQLASAKRDSSLNNITTRTLPCDFNYDYSNPIQ
jgi:hypothetical protein